jgi:FkbM family methyltransferase
MVRKRAEKYGCRLSASGTALEVAKDNRVILLAPKHFVYVPEIAARFESFFNPIIPQYRDGLYIADYSRPAVHTYRRTGLHFELAAFPEEEEALESYVRWYKPKIGDCVFDVGAHCGVSTYHFSRMVGPSGKVVAFEPDPRNFEILLRNILRYGLRNVIPVRAAISGRDGTASFHSEGALGSSLAHISSRATVGDVKIVETMTLARAFDTWGIPDLLKLDIEGSEIEVIASSRDLLRKYPVHLAIDSSHLVDGAISAQHIECMLRDYGFDVESAMVAGGMNTWARSASRAVKCAS